MPTSQIPNKCLLYTEAKVSNKLPTKFSFLFAVSYKSKKEEALSFITANPDFVLLNQCSFKLF